MLLLSDQLLKYCIKDLDERMKLFLDYCLKNNANVNNTNLEQAVRNFNNTLLSLDKTELGEYFKMYIEYEKIRRKRNLDVNWSVDIVSVAQVLNLEQ